MSSSIKLKNANGKTLSVTNSNANQTDKEVIYLNTVDELANASGSINAVAIVSDLDRGGTFEWSATGTANGGTVFAGVSGYWNRQYSGAVNVKWFGAKSGEFDNKDYFINAVSTLSDNDTIYIPAETGSYRYSGGLNFDKPVKILMDNNTILEYTGTSYAIRLGKLGNSGIDFNTWIVSGGKMINGDSCIHGIYVTEWSAYVEIDSVVFDDFGNTDGTSYGVFIQFQTWLAKVNNCTHTTNIKKSNFISAFGRSLSSGSLDLGSIQLFASNNNCKSSSMGGVGIFTSGAGSQIISNKIEGRTPNVWIGSTANGTTVSHNYFEALPTTVIPDSSNDGSCIWFGDDTANITDAIVVSENRCHMHQEYGNTGSFLSFTPIYGATSGLLAITNSKVTNNHLFMTDPSIPAVKLNNLVNQNGNMIVGNTAIKSRTNGSVIQAWKGEEAQELTRASNVGTETGGSFPRVAKAKIDLNGTVTLMGTLLSANFTDPYTVPAGQVLALTPKGYEPNRYVICACMDYSSGTLAHITIDPFGQITSSITLTPSTILGLDNITYNII